MARIKTGLRRQDNDPFLDGTDEGVEVSAGKIGPSRISHKQGVPGEKAVADIEADGTGRMAGGVNHFDVKAAHGQDIPVMEADIDDQALCFIKGLIRNMHGRGNLVVSRQGSIAVDMVPVAVGIDDIPGKDFIVIDHLNDSFIFSAGINDHPFPGFRAGQDIGVDGKVPDIQAVDR